MWIKLRKFLYTIFIVFTLVSCFRILNILNKKCYIGSSQNIERRWYEHKRTLKNQIEVVGVDDFGKNLYYFKSYKEASVFIEKSEVTLYRAIKSGKKFKGCIWKRK